MAKLFISTDSSETAFFCRPAGETRDRHFVTWNGHEGVAHEVLVDKFHVIHPDDVTPGMETAPVPDWLAEGRPCGVGSPAGQMWVVAK